FFQTVMEDVKTAVSFFQAYLTAQLFHAIDWSTLTIADTARRPIGQRTLYTDITYQALLKGGQGYIYLHVEHQRKIDQHMLARNFQYNASLFLTALYVAVF
ncbi:MAG: Rpn family recombination-promoting nuclease/putative transposase, partial [Bacteroidota bacterium]